MTNNWFALLDRGDFLGIDWHFWKVIGWLGNLAFFIRFFIQWYVSEKKKRIIVPVSFWWLSLVGSLCLLLYALCYKRDSVFIFAYLFTWIPYVRNLIIHKRSQEVACPHCAHMVLPSARFCSDCGSALAATPKPNSNANLTGSSPEPNPKR